MRTSKNHGKRLVCFIDSKVLLGAICKGRPSSPSLLQILRRIGALQLAADVHLKVIFVPSSDKPSDAASRGIRSRPADKGRRCETKKRKVDNAMKHASMG